MADRKATDILLKIEQQNTLMLQYMKVIDGNLKKILNLFKSINLGKPSMQPPSHKNDELTFKNKTEKTNSAKTEASAKKETLKEPPKLTVESFVQVSGSENKVIKASDNVGKKRVVHQNLKFKSDNKNVILANIVAKDLDNNIVGKTKTNPTGKWQLSLKPGKYNIHITKGGVKTPPRQPVDLKFNITVKDDDDNELEELKI